jgi:orotate phosphoribosyltransferase
LTLLRKMENSPNQQQRLKNMPLIESSGRPDFAAAQAEVTQHMVEQLRLWRGRLASVPVMPGAAEEADQLFAAQLATRLLELSLRPAAVHDLDKVRQLVRPVGDGKFVTGIELDAIAKMIAETGAILRGHFVLLSELHSEYFFMFSRLGTHLEFRKKLASELGKRFASVQIDSVVAPVTAGGLLVQDVAKELSANFAFYDVDDHSRPFAIRRGYSVHGATLIVNDMTTTGEGVRRMLKVLRDCGARPVGIGLLATRGEAGTQIVNELLQSNLKVEVLFHLAIEAVSVAECGRCRLGWPSVNSADINR